MPIEIIAEGGVNHLGNFDYALEMVDAAKAAYADIIKFQTYDPDLQYKSGSKNHKRISDWCLTCPQFVALAKRCEERGIEFLSTPGDIPSLKFLVEECGVKRIKIGSDDFTNEPLIEAACLTGKPLIMSTGMATLTEIDELTVTIDYKDYERLTLMHCVSLYPCPLKEANVEFITTLKHSFGPRVGYSDHCLSNHACWAAAALGATIIEKHFALTKIYTKAPDFAVSITDYGLILLVSEIRNIECALGTGGKVLSPKELENRNLFRKGPDGRRVE
jgi:N,N'-diacetyllegionaminate synthase